jgi:nucleoside phosphorylase
MEAEKLSHDDYHIGWICALPLEMVAAKAMLDKIHPPLPQARHDRNNYALGEISHHNVVIACLPSGVYGIVSAAVVAEQMLSTFRSIQFSFMVGIGGGVPNPSTDIRLGDVVVSKPTDRHSGVIQYDFGKTIAQGQLYQTGTLNKPPQALLTAISHLQSSYMISNPQIPQILANTRQKFPALETLFAYLGTENDFLFKSEFHHRECNNICSSGDCCDYIVTRPTRTSNIPQVHYGLIASGSQVMKDAMTRDRLVREHDILCFEMEAAGLMDHFPCLVVRGICDYADSHKNENWQPYAAATAAAYARELLCILPAEQVEERRDLLFRASHPLLSDALVELQRMPAHTEGILTTKVFPSFVLHNLIPAESNFLGSLTTNKLYPRQDFHVPAAPLSLSRVDMIVQDGRHTIKTSFHAANSRASSLYTRATSTNETEIFEVDGSRSCVLKNSGQWFEDVCSEIHTRRWIEKQIMRSIKTQIHLVVGFRSLWHERIPITSSQAQVFESPDPMGARMNRGDEANRERPLYIFPGELIYAVQYRKLKFAWYRSRDLDLAQLQRGNCWLSLFTERGDDVDEDEDVIEVQLDSVDEDIL